MPNNIQYVTWRSTRSGCRQPGCRHPSQSLQSERLQRYNDHWRSDPKRQSCTHTNVGRFPSNTNALNAEMQKCRTNTVEIVDAFESTMFISIPSCSLRPAARLRVSYLSRRHAKHHPLRPSYAEAPLTATPFSAAAAFSNLGVTMPDTNSERAMSTSVASAGRNAMPSSLIACIQNCNVKMWIRGHVDRTCH